MVCLLKRGILWKCYTMFPNTGGSAPFVLNLWGKLLILGNNTIPRFRYNPDPGSEQVENRYNHYRDIILTIILFEGQEQITYNVFFLTHTPPHPTPILPPPSPSLPPPPSSLSPRVHTEHPVALAPTSDITRWLKLLAALECGVPPVAAKTT